MKRHLIGALLCGASLIVGFSAADAQTGNPVGVGGNNAAGVTTVKSSKSNTSDRMGGGGGGKGAVQLNPQPEPPGKGKKN
jgi:hypothetical protein